jgi:hypothetical protein
MYAPNARIERLPRYELDGALPPMRGKHTHIPVQGMKSRAARRTFDKLM